MFNPLDSVQLKSESRLEHSDHTKCPKCSKPFTKAKVNGFDVYYCESCRVSHPIPEGA